MSAIIIQQLKETIGPDYENCMVIYRESFPSSERQQESVIRERINTGVATLYVAYQDAVPVGISILFHLKNCQFTFLDYFAVASSSRAGGVGSKLLNYVFDGFVASQVEGSGNPGEQRYLVLEVEDPGYGENANQRKKRITFYQKAGAVVLETTKYFLPPLIENGSPMEMKLMVYPAPVNNFKKTTTDKLITELYGQVYNRDAHDPILRSILG